MSDQGESRVSADKDVIRSYSEQLGDFLSTLSAESVPDTVREVVKKDLIDISGLCVAARNEPYTRQLSAAWDSDGDCTAIGHARSLDAGGAALVNGVGTHGEDFDDTLEGSPIRVGASVIPAVLAAGERFGLSGERVLLGIVGGFEALCRINAVAPGAIHKANFHPVSVIGTLGAAAGVGVALGLDAQRLAMTIGVAASASSGILEYLTEGAWTKRLHPGWAAQAGLRAALFAREGFVGPRQIFEGEHNFFRAFAPSATPDYSHLTSGLGETWYLSRIAFKPYACGTMTHPFIDCAIQFAKLGISIDDIDSVVCETSGNILHRLWEPLADKQRPTTGYAAKFSVPYCFAIGVIDQAAGLSQFTDERVADARVRTLSEKVTYVVDPDNEYPRNYTGHARVTLKSGQVHEFRQPHMRGGARETLPIAEIIVKFRRNIAFGGWSDGRADELLRFCDGLEGLRNLDALKSFRG
jgi:2-methylcitrate dehydratase PrpD